MKSIPPFFSVVIPSRNKGEYLAYAVNALDKQTFRDFEVIFVDDCSNDGSAEMLRKLAEQGRIRFYERGTPGPGGYEARNLGANKARGRWLVFFDADDYLYRNHLQSFHDHIRANPDVSLFVNAYEIFCKGRRINMRDKDKRGLISRFHALGLMARSDFLHMNSVCLRTSFFLYTGGFPEGQFKRGGDVYFWVKALTRVEQIFYSHEITSAWLRDRSGVTSDVANLTAHPLSVFLKKEDCCGLSKQEFDLVKRVINRKIILWARDKRRLGLPFRKDFASLRYPQLSARQALRVWRLALPFNTFGIRSWFSRQVRN